MSDESIRLIRPILLRRGDGTGGAAGGDRGTLRPIRAPGRPADRSRQPHDDGRAGRCVGLQSSFCERRPSSEPSAPGTEPIRWRGPEGGAARRSQNLYRLDTAAARSRDQRGSWSRWRPIAGRTVTDSAARTGARMRCASSWQVARTALALTGRAGSPAPQGVGAASNQPPASAAPASRRDAHLPALAASDTPAGIRSGPGSEVQAGLVLSGQYGGANQQTGLCLFNAYVRNLTRHALKVRCPSFQGLSVPSDRVDYSTRVQTDTTHCSPHVRDNRSTGVETPHALSDDDRRDAVAPGQVAHVSHWMLRTMNIRAKGPIEHAASRSSSSSRGSTACTAM